MSHKYLLHVALGAKSNSTGREWQAAKPHSLRNFQDGGKKNERCFLFFVFFILFVKTGSHSIVLAVLELTVWIELALSS